MKRKMIFALLLCVSVILAFAGCGGEKTVNDIRLTEKACLMYSVGSTFDLAACVEVDPEDAKDGLKYSSSDKNVAEISEKGIITATGFGTATVTVSSPDGKKSASMDVAVYDYTGTYSGEKYVEAMRCTVAVRITLNRDGTFTYYRAPMKVSLAGGGEMPAFSDGGSFTASGTEFSFTSEYLGKFSATFGLTDGKGFLEGKFPTGGAATSLKLEKNSNEDKGESGDYSAVYENDSGTVFYLSLTLDKGKYSLSLAMSADSEGFVISEGSYSFSGNEIQFDATEGESFSANYDAERKVVEGNYIPVTDGYIALTFEFKA